MSDMMNEKKKPEYPTIDEGTYAEDVERGIAEAEKKAAEIERQAKRDRDMALIGDMAHLVSQSAAMHGGAWKIGQAQNEGAKGNERLRALREKNAAQTAAFAKERAALMETKRKEQNAQKLARYNAEVEQYKRDLEAEKYAKEQERKDRQDALKAAETASTIAKNEAYAKFYNSGGKKTSGGGSGVNRDVFIINDDGTKEFFKNADDANNLQAAYAKLPKEYRVVMAVPRVEYRASGKKIYVKDSEGKQVYDYIEDLDASLEQKRQAISDYNNRELIEDWTPEEDEIINYEP